MHELRFHLCIPTTFESEMSFHFHIRLISTATSYRNYSRSSCSVSAVAISPNISRNSLKLLLRLETLKKLLRRCLQICFCQLTAWFTTKGNYFDFYNQIVWKATVKGINRKAFFLFYSYICFKCFSEEKND